MKWFKHDATASLDAKLMKVRLKYGMEGYGVYWYCLEKIVSNIDSHNLTFELEHDAEIMAHETNIHIEVINEMMAFMIDLGLFEGSSGTITCLKIAKRLDQSMTSNPVLRSKIKHIHEVMPDRVFTNNHDGVMTQSCKKRIEENRIEESIAVKSNGKRKKTHAHALPTDYWPKEQTIVSMHDKVKNIEFGTETEKFKDYYAATGRTMKDWDACWRNWIRNAEKFQGASR